MIKFIIYSTNEQNPQKTGKKIQIWRWGGGGMILIIPFLFSLLNHSKYGFRTFHILLFYGIALSFFLSAGWFIHRKMSKMKTIGTILFSQSGYIIKLGDMKQIIHSNDIAAIRLEKHMPSTGMFSSTYQTYIFEVKYKNKKTTRMILSADSTNNKYMITDIIQKFVNIASIEYKLI